MLSIISAYFNAIMLEAIVVASQPNDTQINYVAMAI